MFEFVCCLRDSIRYNSSNNHKITNTNNLSTLHQNLLLMMINNHLKIKLLISFNIYKYINNHLKMKLLFLCNIYKKINNHLKINMLGRKIEPQFYQKE